MAAPFAKSLCGYRSTGNPNTSDNNDAGSIEWGHALFGELGVDPSASEVPAIGAAMEEAARVALGALRPDLTFGSGPAIDFEQYAHLRVFRDFSKAYGGPSPSLAPKFDELWATLGRSKEALDFLAELDKAERRSAQDHELVEQLMANMPDESLLKLDLTAHRNAPAGQRPRLLAGFSSKWTLRTDRAQDCVSQGAKLVNLRRGRMPHYAVLTMEPRPAMLKLLAYGSGSIDCVYHLALPELRAAAERIEDTKPSVSWRPRVELERMVAQGRLRDWDDLVTEITDI